MSDFYHSVYDIVSQIPAGRVATYGQVALLAGSPRAARQVGFALGKLDGDSAVPWHRVVNARGQVSLRAFSEGCEELQEELLADEGVVLDEGGRIDLSKWGWDGPDENPH